MLILYPNATRTMIFYFEHWIKCFKNASYASQSIIGFKDRGIEEGWRKKLTICDENLGPLWIDILEIHCDW